MKKETLVKSLIGFGVLALVVGIGYARAQSILSTLQPKIYVAGNLNYAEAPGLPGSISTSNGGLIGSSQTAATWATAGSVSNQGGLYLWDTDSNSGLEVQGYAHFDSSSQAFFMGTTTFTGPIVGGVITSTVSTFTATGTTTLARLIQGGLVGSLSVTTSTLTAANVCDNSVLKLTPVTTTPTLTLPSTTTLFAACLGTNGQFIDTNVSAITTSSIFAAGTGGTLLNSSSNTIAAGKDAILRIERDSATTYRAYIVNLVN